MSTAVTIERIGVDRDRTLARIEWTTGHATFYPGQSIRYSAASHAARSYNVSRSKILQLYCSESVT